MSAGTVALDAAQDGTIRMGGDAVLAAGDRIRMASTNDLDVVTGGTASLVSNHVALVVDAFVGASMETLSTSIVTTRLCPLAMT